VTRSFPFPHSRIESGTDATFRAARLRQHRLHPTSQPQLTTHTRTSALQTATTPHLTTAPLLPPLPPPAPSPHLVSTIPLSVSVVLPLRVPTEREEAGKRLRSIRSHFVLDPRLFMLLKRVWGALRRCRGRGREIGRRSLLLLL
jgi:hypothetical protein